MVSSAPLIAEPENFSSPSFDLTPPNPTTDIRENLKAAFENIIALDAPSMIFDDCGWPFVGFEDFGRAGGASFLMPPVSSAPKQNLIADIMRYRTS